MTSNKVKLLSAVVAAAALMASPGLAASKTDKAKAKYSDAMFPSLNKRMSCMGGRDNCSAPIPTRTYASSCCGQKFRRQLIPSYSSCELGEAASLPLCFVHDV